MCDCLRGSHNTNSLLKELITMGNLMKFHTKDLPELMDRINRYSIGMDDYFDRLGTLHETQSCLLYTSPSPRDVEESRMPSSA